MGEQEPRYRSIGNLIIQNIQVTPVLSRTTEVKQKSPSLSMLQWIFQYLRPWWARRRKSLILYFRFWAVKIIGISTRMSFSILTNATFTRSGQQWTASIMTQRIETVCLCRVNLTQMDKNMMFDISIFREPQYNDVCRIGVI